MIDQVLKLDFGRDGNADNYLGGGWSTGEAGFRWMVGEASELWLENPGEGGHLVLEFDLRPFVRPPELPMQRLAVLVRGTEIGRVELKQGGLLGWRIPPALVTGPGPVRVTFRHPDARRPKELSDGADERALSVSVHGARLLRIPAAPPLRLQASGSEPGSWRSWSAGLPMTTDAYPREQAQHSMPAADLVMRFESLGDNCELGLVQRRCGKEPLGLLRFANIMLPSLLRGVSTGFDRLGSGDTLQLWDDADNKEYVVRDMGYGITYHTFLYKDQVSDTGLLARQGARLKFLARKLLEDMSAAEKVFVVKRNETLAEAEILPLYAAMRARGDCTLLWVMPADEQHPAGTVESVLPGLIRGWIDRFAPYENAHDLSFAGWLEVCRQAHNLAFRSNVARVTLPDAPAGADRTAGDAGDTDATAAALSN